MLSRELLKLAGLQSRYGFALAPSSRYLTTTSVVNAEKKKETTVVPSGSSSGEAIVPAGVKMVPGQVDSTADEPSTLPEPEMLRPSGETLIYEGPDRDLVNFPRPQMPLYQGRCRLYFIPEEWFDFFYKKTGVSGPYVFGAGLLTTLFSKELWVIEHEFPLFPVIAFVTIFTIKKWGPAIKAYSDKEIDEHEEGLIQMQEGVINNYKESIKAEEKAQWMAKGQGMLIEAKRENVKLQLEAEYRQRLSEVYKEVKRRLDYQVEVINTRRRVEQRHMVNWIVNNVMRSIDEKQEAQNIDKCIANLKQLASK